MRSATPRQCCLATTALSPKLQPAYDRAARNIAGLARELGVSTTMVEMLMHGGKTRPSTAERVEAAFVAYLERRTA